MDSTGKILLGTSATAAGALLGFALWYGVIPPSGRTVAAPAAPLSQPAPEAKAVSAKEAEQEFETLSRRLRVALKVSTFREETMQRAARDLEAFTQKYPGTPAADKARLSLGNILLTQRRYPAALEAFQAIAEDSRDRKLAALARLLVGKTQAESGRMGEARATLTKLVSEEKDSEIGQAARQALGQASLETGARPPAFAMKDLAGNEQSLERLRGKVVLLDFWATWCGPCKKEMPNLKRLHARYNKQGFEILGISLDTDRDALQKYIREEGIPWPQLCDGLGAKGKLAREMGVQSIPKMILLDRKGLIHTIDARGAELEEAVEELISG